MRRFLKDTADINVIKTCFFAYREKSKENNNLSSGGTIKTT
jgi:hypothetical protein